MYKNLATYMDSVYTDSSLCAQLFPSHRLPAPREDPRSRLSTQNTQTPVCMAVTGPCMGAQANRDAGTRHTWPAQVATQGHTEPGELGCSSRPGWACWPGPRHAGGPSSLLPEAQAWLPQAGVLPGPLPALCMAGPKGSCACPSRG